MHRNCESDPGGHRFHHFASQTSASQTQGALHGHFQDGVLIAACKSDVLFWMKLKQPLSRMLGLHLLS